MRAIKEMFRQTAGPAATVESLYAGLDGRERPEAVARAILAVLDGILEPRERRLLERAARSGWGYSYMSAGFEPTASIIRPANLLAELIGAEPLPAEAGTDPSAIRALLEKARANLGMNEGRTSFKHDRENREARRARGLEISRRRYDKLFRLVGRLEQYVVELETQRDLFRLSRFAKTAFAVEIPFERFRADRASAAFVAYYTANLARRSLFIAGPQARAFDNVAEALLALCERTPTTDWYVVAHVFPRADVLARLTVKERVGLLERALGVLQESAEALEVLAARDVINLESMVVRKGNDSSTWNTLAGAWNRARDYWIALVYALGQAEMFDAFLPGKVLRLMAADVAWWHRAKGGDVHDDTSVWAALRKPWEVVAGRASCTRTDVEATCRRFGIDPEKTGWSAPRPRRSVDVWRPTPETVHGVVVDHPELALFLRKVGVFSGKGLRLPVGG